VVKRLLVRRRDVMQGSEQLAAFGDVRFHDFRLRQQSLAQISGQRQIGAPVEERADSVEAAAMLLAHLSHRLLAQERHQCRIEIFLLEADVGARLLIDPASRPPGTDDVSGTERAGKFVEAAAQYRMIFPEGREQFRKYLFGTCKLSCNPAMRGCVAIARRRAPTRAAPSRHRWMPDAESPLR
jgi:hypothetical protein